MKRKTHQLRNQEDKEHYRYLRSRRIGEDKARKMAREMTNIDKRGKR